MATKTKKPLLFRPFGVSSEVQKFGRETEGAVMLRNRLFGSEPVETREMIARAFWENAMPLGGCRNEAERQRAVFVVGGAGLIAWCLDGFPAGKIDEYIRTDFRLRVTDKARPLADREIDVRELWEKSMACLDCPTEEDRNEYIAGGLGSGVLSWCLAGCPDGQIDLFIEAQGGKI